MSQRAVQSPGSELTELQLKCLEGFWNRRSAKQISADLRISEAWVNKNLLAARRKLHVNGTADAAAMANLRFCEARGLLAEAHRAFRETQLEIGLKAFSYGDFQECPSSTGELSVVARQ